MRTTQTKQTTPVEHYGDVKIGYTTFRLPLDKAHAFHALLAYAVEVRDIYSGGGGKYLRRMGDVTVALADKDMTTFDATMLTTRESDEWDRELSGSLNANQGTKLVDCVPPAEWKKLKGE